MRQGFASIIVGIGLMGFGLALAAPPARATALVSAFADSGDYLASSGDIDPELAGEPHLSARAHASATTSHAEIAAGSLPSCGQSPCAHVSNPPEAGAYASANGNNGTLRVAAQASDGSGARARATATLIDTITLTSPVVDIFIDIDALGGGNVQSPGQTKGRSSLFFTMFLHTPDDIGDTPDSIILFAFEVQEEEGEDSFRFAYLLDDELLEVDSGTSVPPSLHYEIDLSSEPFAFLFEPLFPSLPAAFDLDGPLALGFSLSARADCDSSNCFAQARADQSLYIGLQGTSASGYNYPGVQQGPGPDPDPTEVPEPASLLLFVGGLFGLATLARRSTARLAIVASREGAFRRS